MGLGVRNSVLVLSVCFVIGKSHPSAAQSTLHGAKSGAGSLGCCCVGGSTALDCSDVVLHENLCKTYRETPVTVINLYASPIANQY